MRRCSGHLVTKISGDYQFFLSSDDGTWAEQLRYIAVSSILTRSATARNRIWLKGSLLYLDGEKVVDNDGCHGETEKSSEQKFLAAGSHKLAVEMCDVSGGEVFKMRYQGPDTSKSKITVPKWALKHSKACSGVAYLRVITFLHGDNAWGCPFR